MLRDLKDKKIGYFTIGNETEKRAKDGSILIECICVCGNIKYYPRRAIINTYENKKSNRIAYSCGCFPFNENLIGKKYNMFTIIGVSPHKDYDGRPMWECRCDCGNIKHYRTNRAKTTISCGCINSLSISKIFPKEYSTWKNMKQRCLNKNSKNYERYGGRGITVCERWQKSFNDFLMDMGEKPSKNHSIERINNEGDYEPSNCRWATPEEQRLNTRKQKNNTSGVVGVSKKRNKWIARIEHQGKSIYLGSFDCKEEAIKERRKQELKIYGKYLYQ